MKLLLLSNSTNPGEDYLAYTLPYINDFIANKKPVQAVFIPYAGVSLTWDKYHEMVSSKFRTLDIQLQAIHQSDNPVQAILHADLIVVGGGNTFNLLKTLQENRLIEPIRERIKDGVPYIGWSAGSNMACPSIKTTNDMPIVEPENFSALGIIPFQINPHFTDGRIEGHGGESREMRLAEFLIVNKGIYVAGLQEGTMFQIEGRTIKLIGNKPCRIFLADQEPKDLNAGEDFSFLMQ